MKQPSHHLFELLMYQLYMGAERVSKMRDKKEKMNESRKVKKPGKGRKSGTEKQNMNHKLETVEDQVMFHLATAVCTNFTISSFACFFALSVIPSNISNALGDVCSGSNSSVCPSFVGTATLALNPVVRTGPAMAE